MKWNRYLVLKCICRLGKVSPTDVERGTADLGQLRQGAMLFKSIADRLALVEGNSRTTPAMIRGKCLQAMSHHQAEKSLIVIDYLQRMAHALDYQSLRENVGELSLHLRRSPTGPGLTYPGHFLLEPGRLRGGQTGAFMEKLKESGDIEYSADVVLMLQEDKPDRPSS
jgi:replicative DNA helicase